MLILQMRKLKVSDAKLSQGHKVNKQRGQNSNAKCKTEEKFVPVHYVYDLCKGFQSHFIQMTNLYLICLKEK